MFLLSEVGPEIAGMTVRLRICLPGIPVQAVVFVYITAKRDQFDPRVKSRQVALQADPPADPLWGEVEKNRWSTPPLSDLPAGTYLYRFEIVAQRMDGSGPAKSIYFGDPFARETGGGIFSIFQLPQPPPTPIDHGSFLVPRAADLVIYELNVAEFGGSFMAVAERIHYLKSLGVNAIELLPINSIEEPNQWGYMPIFYFAPEERFGGPRGLRHLVSACHHAGIAVVLDMVYAHTDRMFPYQVGYERFVPFWEAASYQDGAGAIHRAPNPLVSSFSNYGRKSDWRMCSTREFFAAVNAFWLAEYGVDGFRYDHVNGYLDRDPIVRDGTVHWFDAENRPNFSSLRDLSKATYQESKRYARFGGPQEPSRLIQIAEDLNESAYQLSPKARNAITGCWEKQLADLAQGMAGNDDRVPATLVRELLMADRRYDAQDYSGSKRVDDDEIPALPVIYLESHDECRLFYLMQHAGQPITDGYDYRSGLDGEPWWRLQPYAIALMTCVGTPMLWAGQEFAENSGVAASGQVRVRGLHPLHFDYFYNPDGDRSATNPILPLCRLYRFLGTLRHSLPALRGGRDEAVEESTDVGQGTVVYRRWQGNQVLIVAINFSDAPRAVEIPFGHVGWWTDMLEQCYHSQPYQVQVSDASRRVGVPIPSHFGRILVLTPTA